MASSSSVPPLSCIEEGTEACFSNPPENQNPSGANEGRDRELHGQPLHSQSSTDPSQRPRIPKARRCSAVSVDYFDPEGVSTLSKSLEPTRDEETHSSNSGPTTSEDSEATLPGGAEKPVDFEQVLRYHLKKLVFSSFVLVLCLTSFLERAKLALNRVSSELPLKTYGS